MNEEIQEAEQGLQALQQVRQERAVTSPTSFSPAQEIESNLTGLLRFRIDRIKRGATFEEALEQAMLDRLPEATYSEMLMTLSMIKRDQNDSTASVLSPFIAKSDRVPLLDSDKARERAGSDDQLATQASKEVLQGLGELSKLLSLLGKAVEPSEGGASATEGKTVKNEPV